MDNIFFIFSIFTNRNKWGVNSNVKMCQNVLAVEGSSNTGIPNFAS